MPDLDLIKQAESGVRAVRQGQSAISSGPSMTATNAGDFAADLLQKQQTGG